MSPETALSTKRNEPICSQYKISKILVNKCRFSMKYREKGSIRWIAYTQS